MKPSRMQQRLATAPGRRTAPAKATSGDAWTNGFNQVADELAAAEAKRRAKGKQGGNCNRTACQSPGAFFFNTSTSKYYCRWCAQDINRFALNSEPKMDLFPNFEAELADYHKWYEGLERRA